MSSYNLCGGRALRIAIGIMMLVLLSGNVNAATLTVDNSGGADYTSIQNAINAANAGDTILVYSGTYLENVTVNKRVTLQGEGADVVTVKGTYRGFDVSVDHVNISGFNVLDASDAGIYLGSHLDGSHGDYAHISNNKVSNNYRGIYLSYSDRNTLTNNNASKNTYGILLTSSGNNTLTNNTALENTNGIRLQYYTNNTLTNNNASKNVGGITLFYTSRNTLTDNTVNSNNNYGISLSSSSSNTIYNNYFNNANNAVDTGNNFWNTTPIPGINIIGGPYLGGNYWSNYAGVDTDGDGLGDTLIPYNTGITKGGDYHPLMTVDTTAPSITIISPVNTIYTNASITLNVTTTETANVTYSLNGAANLSIYNLTTSGNTPITGIEGANNVTVYASDSAGNLNYSTVNFTIDTTPPASITNLNASAYAQTYLNWTWTCPADPDFANVSVWIDNVFMINVSKGMQFYNATDLAPGSGHTISTRTSDTNSNVNQTWVNHTAITKNLTEPSIKIYTNKLTYIAGNKMYVGLNLTNPGIAKRVKIDIWVDLSGGRKLKVASYPSITLPAGLDYKMYPWMSITLPNIPEGNYAWHAVIKNTASGTIISESISPWTFSKTVLAGSNAEIVLPISEIDFAKH